MPPAADRWKTLLASWAIPQPILDAAPESPWGFSVELFAAATDAAMAAETPSRREALAALPDGGSVLDVGCGGGAGSMPLVPPASSLIGVDESAGMLASFAERAERLGVAHTEIEGRWPDVEARTPQADVVVCHNVFYNAGDLVPFVEALASHARRRVVVELTDEHPRAWLTPYWAALHGLDRPDGPHTADAVAVLKEMGVEPSVERWQRAMHRTDLHAGTLVASLRRMLCVSPERDEEVAAAVERFGVPAERTVATVWWDVR